MTALVDFREVAEKRFWLNDFRTSDLHLHPKHSVMSRMVAANPNPRRRFAKPHGHRIPRCSEVL
jgi:hypothetical protein